MKYESDKVTVSVVRHGKFGAVVAVQGGCVPSYLSIEDAEILMLKMMRALFRAIKCRNGQKAGVEIDHLLGEVEVIDVR